MEAVDELEAERHEQCQRQAEVRPDADHHHIAQILSNVDADVTKASQKRYGNNHRW